jgi:ribosome maturation protein SDO1
MSEKYTLVRYSHAGEKFEILVDPDKGLSYKRGEIEDVSDVVKIDTVFLDSSKGEKASTSKLEEVFGTSDPLKVAEIMLDKGTLQLTAQQRKKLMEQKIKQIINFISQSYVDPATKLPHPTIRIKNAFEEANVSIDPLLEAEEQVSRVVKALRPIIPLSIEALEIALKIPPNYASKSYGIAKNMGEIKRDEWQQDGSWIAVVEISAALHGEFLDRLGKVTQGNIQSKIMK